MTDKTYLDSMEQQFEEWAHKCNKAGKVKKIDLRLSANKSFYESNETELMWQAWKASRQAVVVILPDTTNGYLDKQVVEHSLIDNGLRFL